MLKVCGVSHEVVEIGSDLPTLHNYNKRSNGQAMWNWGRHIFKLSGEDGHKKSNSDTQTSGHLNTWKMNSEIDITTEKLFTKRFLNTNGV